MDASQTPQMICSELYTEKENSHGFRVGLLKSHMDDTMLLMLITQTLPPWFYNASMSLPQALVLPLNTLACIPYLKVTLDKNVGLMTSCNCICESRARLALPTRINKQ